MRIAGTGDEKDIMTNYCTTGQTNPDTAQAKMGGARSNDGEGEKSFQGLDGQPFRKSVGRPKVGW